MFVAREYGQGVSLQVGLLYLLQESGLSSSCVKTERVASQKRSKELPYYFCDICGKVYITQDDLIKHRSSAHDNPPHQSQFSQLGDAIDNSTNLDTAQHDKDNSAVQNNPSTSAQTENGKTDRKKKVASVFY